MLLGSCLHSCNDFFYLMLRCRQADSVASVSSPLSLTPEINDLQCCCCWRLIIAGMKDKLVAGVKGTGDNQNGPNRILSCKEETNS
jgi:hypothetical protein